jgi:hypothetical protein
VDELGPERSKGFGDAAPGEVDGDAGLELLRPPWVTEVARLSTTCCS